MIWYNAPVNVRALLLAASLFSPAITLAQPAPTPIVLSTSGGSAVTGTSGAMVSGMKPGVPAKPAEKHPYFFAAYVAVWLGLFAYVAWLASRLRSLDEKP